MKTLDKLTEDDLKAFLKSCKKLADGEDWNEGHAQTIIFWGRDLCNDLFEE